MNIGPSLDLLPAGDAIKNPTLTEVTNLWKLKLDVSGTAAPAEAAASTTTPSTG